MINNAGVMPQSLLERLKIDWWDRMIDVNIRGVLYGNAAALPYLKQQKAGHFINVSSVAGHRFGPGLAVYAATKHAVRALSVLRLRRDLAFVVFAFHPERELVRFNGNYLMLRRRFTLVVTFCAGGKPRAEPVGHAARVPVERFGVGSQSSEDV